MKNIQLLVLLFAIAAFTAACDETDTGGGGNVVADRILAISEFDGDDEEIKVGGVAGAVPPGSEVVVTNQDTGEIQTTTGNQDGSFDPPFEGSTDDTFLVEVFQDEELIDTTDLSVITLESLVNANLAQLGSVPAVLKIRGNRAYVINGFSDNIQVFDINQNPPVQLDTIVLPPASNPIDMDFINDSQALVANNIGQTAAIVNLDTFECETLYTRQVDVPFEPCDELINLGTGRFEEPSGVKVVGSTAYVSNNNLDNNFSPNGNGFITVIDLNSDSSFVVQAGGANSGNFLLVQDELFFINAGNILFNPVTFAFNCDPLFTPSINVINTNTNTISDLIPIPLSDTNSNVCLPGSFASTPGNEFGYIGLGLVGALLKVDLEDKEIINGTDNPILITENLSDLNNTSSIVIDENGIGYTALFNTDQIAVFNTENDEVNPFPAIAPFPAGLRAFNPDSEFIDGVQELALREGLPGSDFTGPNLFYITGISSQLGSVNANIIVP